MTTFNEQNAINKNYIETAIYFAFFAFESKDKNDHKLYTMNSDLGDIYLPADKILMKLDYDSVRINYNRKNNEIFNKKMLESIQNDSFTNFIRTKNYNRLTSRVRKYSKIRSKLSRICPIIRNSLLINCSYIVLNSYLGDKITLLIFFTVEFIFLMASRDQQDWKKVLKRLLRNATFSLLLLVAYDLMVDYLRKNNIKKDYTENIEKENIYLDNKNAKSTFGKVKNIVGGIIFSIIMFKTSEYITNKFNLKKSVIKKSSENGSDILGEQKTSSLGTEDQKDISTHGNSSEGNNLTLSQEDYADESNIPTYPTFSNSYRYPFALYGSYRVKKAIESTMGTVRFERLYGPNPTVTPNGIYPAPGRLQLIPSSAIRHSIDIWVREFEELSFARIQIAVQEAWNDFTSAEAWKELFRNAMQQLCEGLSNG